MKSMPEITPKKNGKRTKSVLRELKESATEKALFLHQFAQNPRTVGSITPSSDFLVRTMVKPVQWDNARTIVELGAGTGVITRYIEKLRHPESQCIVFELDLKMRLILEEQYPGMDFHANATDLMGIIHEKNLAVDCILSGLPFANFDQQLRNSILDGVVDSLKTGGVFITFQYSLQMKNQLQQRFSRVDIRFSPLNIPPAFVYCCYK